MKAIFGVLSLLVVLAIVGTLAKKQLQAVAPGSSRAAAVAGSAAPFAVDPNASTVPEQARSMQEQARTNTARALEQGVQRNQRADP